MDFLALKEPPFPSGVGDDDIQHHPLKCWSCFNLSARSASSVGVIEGLWRVSFRDVDSTPFGREVSLPELRATADSGCVTCKLLTHAIIELTDGAVAFDNPLFTVTLNFAKGNVFRISIREKEKAEDEEDEETLFAFPEKQFDPDAPCPWPTIGCSMKSYGPIQLFGSDATEGGPVRHLATHPCSESGINTVKKWINSCKSSHSVCMESDASPNRIFPKRVVSLGPPTNDDIRLLDHGGALDKIRPPYIALSYCWGTSAPFRTTQETLEERKTNIPFASIHRTFQDAVTISRNLGIQYLWIDAICIIQGDLKDWETEAAKMASIYGDADLVLSITESADTATGFLFDRKPLLKMPGTFPNGDRFEIYGRESVDHDHFGLSLSEQDQQIFTENGERVFVKNYRNRVYEKYSLMTRGWCYQERLLASRVLHVTNSEMIYDCGESVDCECGTLLAHEDSLFTPFRRTIKISDKAAASHFQHHEAWREMVVHYSHRHLTAETDRLPALAGLALKWTNKLTGRYLAGLWEKDLFRGLCWRPDTDIEEVLPKKTSKYLGPSWSWVSLQRAVTWRGAASESTKSHVEFDFDRTECLKDKKFSYGEVDSGHVFVTGTVLEVAWIIINGGLWLWGQGEMGRPNRCFVDVDHPSRLVEDLSVSQVYCLRLCSKTFTQFANDDDYALVLVKASEDDLERQPSKVKQFSNVYRRIGFTECYQSLGWDEKAHGKRTELYII